MSNFIWMTKVSLVETTAQECQHWGLTMFPVIGTSQEKLATIQLLASLPEFPVHIVTNYETLNSKPLRDALNGIKFDVCVVDEVHRLKGGANPSPTQIWENSRDFIQFQKERNGCYPMFLSGSIVNNKLSEMWAYLHIFDPVRFDDLKTFEATFGDMTWMAGTGYTPKKLLETVAPNMIRRGLNEVATELPDCTTLQPEIIHLDSRSELYKLHKQINEDVLVAFDSLNDDAPLTITSVLAQLHYARSILLAPGTLKYNYYPVNEEGERGEAIRREYVFEKPFTKLEAVADTAFELATAGENVVIFTAQFNTPLDYMSNRINEWGMKSAVIKGGSNVAAIQNAFQQNELNVLLVNLQSGAEGLNLHRSDRWPGGASHVLFLDRWWNPEKNRQGLRRCYRIGTNKPVFEHKFFVDGSVDLVIDAIEQRKIADNESFTESTSLRAGEWKTMLHKYLK